MDKKEKMFMDVETSEVKIYGAWEFTDKEGYIQNKADMGAVTEVKKDSEGNWYQVFDPILVEEALTIFEGFQSEIAHYCDRLQKQSENPTKFLQRLKGDSISIKQDMKFISEYLEKVVQFKE